MNHWPFIIAAYAIALAGSIGLVWRSYAAMRRAEDRAGRITGRRQ